ncbi:MAG: hypothetical protein ACP5I4_15460 [Oceanipulchritudo sp.]
MLGGISRTTDGGLDPVPMSGSPAYSAPFSAPVNDFFDDVDFKGAFSLDTGNWAAGWTYLSQQGYFGAEGAWILTDNPGYVYSYLGFLGPDQFVYSLSLDNFVHIGSDDANGSWVYVTR